MTIRRQRPGNPSLAVALLRVSTEDQRLGPEAQRSAITTFASREGVEVAAWHVEQGVSGATPLEQRAGLLAAIEDVRRIGAGRLLVAKRDRLARDVMLSAMIERLVERAGARVFTADGTSNGEGPEGVLMRGIVDLFAQYERLLIGSRTRAALAAKKARGERAGGVPFGFVLGGDGKKLLANERESAVVSAVQEMRAAGISIRKIVTECARRGFVSRSGRAFAKTQVERMLHRKAA